MTDDLQFVDRATGAGLWQATTATFNVLEWTVARVHARHAAGVRHRPGAARHHPRRRAEGPAVRAYPAEGPGVVLRAGRVATWACPAWVTPLGGRPASSPPCRPNEANPDVVTDTGLAIPRSMPPRGRSAGRPTSVRLPGRTRPGGGPALRRHGERPSPGLRHRRLRRRGFCRVPPPGQRLRGPGRSPANRPSPVAWWSSARRRVPSAPTTPPAAGRRPGPAVDRHRGRPGVSAADRRRRPHPHPGQHGTAHRLRPDPGCAYPRRQRHGPCRPRVDEPIKVGALRPGGHRAAPQGGGRHGGRVPSESRRGEIARRRPGTARDGDSPENGEEAP